MRFNPPPNWPPPPPGWVPDASWTPDPSWPPPPPDWPFWVDDPAPRKRKALWMALALAAVIILVAGSVFAVAAGRRTPGAEGAGGSAKPNITQLNRDLLVGKSAFPDFDGGKRRSGLGANDPKASGMPGLSVDPQECADFLGSSKTATQTAYATVSKLDRSGLRSMEVHLAITPERRDLQGDLKKCQSFTVSLEMAGRSLMFDAQLDPLDAQGAPPWAVATVMKRSGSPFPGIPISMSMTTAAVSGYYRGVLVVASSSRVNPRGKDSEPADSDSQDLVRLFNAQVDNLEAAP